MDALKLKRTPLRSAFTRLLNAVNEACDESKKDDAKIETSMTQLHEKYLKLREVDADILNSLLTENVSEEEYTKEFEACETYAEKFIACQVKVKRLVTSPVTSSIVPGSAPADPKFERHGLRLPELSIEKFDGNPRMWLKFWNAFKGIHEDKTLDDHAKFVYLIQVTKSKARDIVDSFPTTADNYQSAIDHLKQRFGREDTLIQVYVRDLLQLVLKNHTVSRKDFDLPTLYDSLSTKLRSLESLGVTEDKYESILFPLVESCLPTDILRVWERDRNSSKQEKGKSDLDSILKFLKNEVVSEERVSLARTSFECNKIKKFNKNSDFYSDNVPTAADLFNSDSFKSKVKTEKKEAICIFCDKSHFSENCFKASSLSYDEKEDIIRKKGACLICFRKNHIARNCKSKVKCIVCSKRHLALLCPEVNNQASCSKSEVKKENGDNVLSSQATSSDVLLQTLIVRLENENKSMLVRAIIDTGSENSYVTKDVIRYLKYQSVDEIKLVHKLFGGVESKQTLHRKYKVQLKSIDNKYNCKMYCLDNSVICSDVKRVPSGPWIKELNDSHIQLSDIKGTACHVDTEIKLLIGADVAGKLLTGKIKLLSSGPVAVQTHLGWTLMGKISCSKTNEIDEATVVTSLFLKDSKIADLWKLDTIGIVDPVETKTKLEVYEQTVNYFEKTLNVDTNGRYEIALPWVLDNKLLPSNKKLAENRLVNTKRKLIALGKVEDYQAVFDNWLSEGIIEEVFDDQNSLVHFLPHRPVIKDDNKTTKIRPVFDASAHSKGSPSLNDCLEKGPNLIEIIPTIINRFRKYRIGVTSDIEKAFLQISVREQDRDFLRFLWYDRENSDHIRTYRHCRVVFGVTSSPFLLGATLKHHLAHAPENLRDTANILHEAFYVDNCLTSFEREEQLEKFIQESEHLLSAAHFNLRGWQSNISIGAIDPPELSNKPEYLKTVVLGLIWNRRDDTLSCKINYPKNEDRLETKRSLLSVANHIFDPIGFTAPVTLIPKLILQEVWKLKLKWDEKLPETILSQFRKWLEQLPTISKIKIPRCLNLCSDEIWRLSIHVFCDASKKAYATCIFLRVEHAANISVQLLQAKTRVAPLKPITIPRLELLACLIGARLSTSVMKDLKLTDVRCFYWTDSSTALSWIQRDIQWGTFVYNRVKEIRELSRVNDWGHVPSNKNPADLLSRGCHAEELLRLQWWEGPFWLYENSAKWPKSESIFDEAAINAEKRKTVLISNSKRDERFDWHFSYFSSYKKIIRMVAWVFRFIRNARKINVTKSSNISCSEFEDAEKVAIRLIQKEAFQGEADDKLRALKPFLDEFCILRAKTKISFRDDFHDFKYPVILPNDHPVVLLMIKQKHEELMHAGVSIVMTHLRENYWILQTRKTVRKVIKKCIRCQRFTTKKCEAEPGFLPKDRVRDATSFEITGVDLAGPLYLKNSQKAYIVLYTCAVYRAVHLELITSLSTEAFFQSLRRFISRRGRPKVMYSDNGSNFVGAERILQSLDWNRLSTMASEQKIQWKFNPPSAAWWGGWWERLIQMVKQILRKVLGRASLEYEELQTLLCDCENVVNMRPLTYVSEDIDDISPLTPQMFLRDNPGTGVPDIDLVEKGRLSKRATYLQQLRVHLRKRFRNEYLGQLRQPAIKDFRHNPLQEGDIVLVEDPSKKRAFWNLARVLKTIPGRDGHVRLARIKTETTELLRPIQRLYKLELDNTVKNDMDEPLPLVTGSGRVVKQPKRL